MHCVFSAARLLTIYRLGVYAGISAWNGTQVFVYWKIAPALAAGNTVSPRHTFLAEMLF